MNTSNAAVLRKTPSKAMNIGLWVVQVLLALIFGAIGLWKSFSPISELSQNLPWVSQELALLVRFVGVSELFGAIGLILPAATRIQPKLTALAAAGIALIMVLASGFHISRGELSAVPVTLVLGSLAVFVLWGRWKRVAIEPRSTGATT